MRSLPNNSITYLSVYSTMKKRVFACLILLGMTFLACTFTQKVRTGLQAYEVKQYSVAAKLFEKEYAASTNPKDQAQLAFLAGESYSYLNDRGSAGNWYLKAYKDGFGDQALEKYAEALKHQERYEEALAAYTELLKLNSSNAAYRSNVTLTRQAIDLSRQPVKAIEVSPVNFNTSSSDYSPQPIGHGLVLFTSDRGSKERNDTYLWTGRSFSDLFVSNHSGQVTAYDAVINTEANEGTGVLSPDGNVLVFTRCSVDEQYDAWCKLMMSVRKGNTWSAPEPLPFIKEKINYGHPAFAARGTTLFFSSDAPEGQGGDDLYFTQPDGAGGWTAPVNLGSLINTAGNEQYPTVYKDTLYFSSDRLAGLGGMDIFKTYLDVKAQWVPPVNMKAPINSGADDFGFVVDTFALLAEDEVMKGYFSSSRAGSGRSDDIYSFVWKGEVQDDVAESSEENKPEEIVPVVYQVFLSLRVMEPQFEIPDDPNSRVIGRRPLPNGPVIFDEGATSQRFTTDELGQMVIRLELDKDYNITGRYRDHLASSIKITTRDLDKDPANPIITINQTLVLDPIFKNKEIVLENIFYDYDQWVIREDAKPSLNALSNIMKTNPGIRIQLSSHTDCRGTDEYNQDLSQKRAQAAIEYLMSVGIPAQRLEAQGFGESAPAVMCECESCTEADHQKNRRTTFKIID